MRTRHHRVCVCVRQVCGIKNNQLTVGFSTSAPDFQATKDLENFDKTHHEEFKQYEMWKEHERRERLKSMSEEERKKEEQHYEEMKKKHANHPKVNHPVSVRAQYSR